MKPGTAVHSLALGDGGAAGGASLGATPAPDPAGVHERARQPMTLPAELGQILAETPGLERAYLVGGCVRDWCWGIPVADYDLEVFGLDYERLVAALSRWGRTDLVGRSFGVVKLKTDSGAVFDFTVPRQDTKRGSGHRGFDIALEPQLSLTEAAARRDFTFNALFYDPRERRVLDYVGGLGDLRDRVLRHTSAAFGEDPLRVLRGMQFAGRFGLEAAPATVSLCGAIRSSYAELPVERVREEWFKWAAKSLRPSAGLEFLAATGWRAQYPELEALAQTDQDPEWHPEGNVWIHTRMACDALVQLPGWQTATVESRIVYMLAVLTHDLGKPATTQTLMRDGRLRTISPGHEHAGVELAASFLERINAPGAVRDRVLPLVANHMAAFDAVTDRSIRRLARRLAPETISGLCLVLRADQAGRPTGAGPGGTAVAAIEAKALELELQAGAPQPLVQGRHLMAWGLTPGRAFGPILRAAFEAQLEGVFGDLAGARQWFSQHQGWRE